MLTIKINNTTEKFLNQYFYSELVGTYIIELPDKTVLFDLPIYNPGTKSYLLEKKKPLIAILSHGSCGIADGTIWQKEIELKVYLHQADQHHSWLQMKPNVFFKESLQLDNKLQVIHAPGHSPGSVCVLDNRTKTLFSGDTVEGTSQGTIHDFTHNAGEDIQTRLTSCQKLLHYDFQHLLPFHYQPIMNTAKETLNDFINDKFRL